MDQKQVDAAIQAALASTIKDFDKKLTLMETNAQNVLYIFAYNIIAIVLCEIDSFVLRTLPNIDISN